MALSNPCKHRYAKINNDKAYKKYPQEAVQIQIKLLPVEHQTSTDTNKPLFLDIFPDDWQIFLM